MKLEIWTGVKKALSSEPKQRASICAARRKTTSFGFSEDGSESFKDLDANMPPPGANTNLAHQLRISKTARAPKGSTPCVGVKIDKDGTKRPHYCSHRERLRTRFLTGGHEAMPEYELLELLLFNAIPRFDVRPLAERLLLEFGDLNGVIAASKHRILQVDGANVRVFYQLRVAEACALNMAQRKLHKRDVISSWDALITYCRTAMAHRENEQLRVFYLDRKNALIADEAQAQGTVDHVPIYPREVAKRALELNASAVIVVHNHPSGDPKPSLQDDQMTQQLLAACEAISVTLHDHIVIGKEDEFSFKRNGWL